MLLVRSLVVTGNGASAPASRAPRSGRQLLLLSYIGVLLHVFMDFLNSYGVRLLMPFSERWFYGDALYIVDPWLYLLLGARLVAGVARAKRGRAAVPPAQSAWRWRRSTSLAMLGSNLLGARARCATAWRARAGRQTRASW